MSLRSSFQIPYGDPLLGDGENVGEIQLFFRGAKLGEEIKRQIQHFVGTCGGLVDLVDDDEHPEARGE